MQYIAVVFIVASALSGCAGSKPAQPPAKPPGGRNPDVEAMLQTDDALREVLEAPAIEFRDEIKADQKDIQHIPVRMPMDFSSDAEHFTLYIDSANQTAWLESHGGISNHLRRTYGPWPTDCPEMKRLIELVAEPSHVTTD